MIVVLIVLSYLIIGYLEIKYLLKVKKIRELFLYTITLVFAFTLSILLSLGVKIPNPAKPIEKIIMSILNKI